MLSALASARRRPALLLGLDANIVWKYKVIALSDSTNYSADAYDDSAWPSGSAPFGDVSKNQGVANNAHAFDARFPASTSTFVATNKRLWLRGVCTLHRLAPGGYQLVGYFDNSYVLYVNGALASDGSGIVDSGVRTHLDTSLFRVGINHIAVRCDDDLAAPSFDACYFDFLLDPIYG